ncbi:MAG: hypothetical protein PS018_26500 [bacterium]|nr:hypothetical protein [bacterium]
MPAPKITDNDRDEITASINGDEIRAWEYHSETERRTKMLAAKEFAEGWYQAMERASRVRAALEDIAASDDIDNALDPERNKRVASTAISAYRASLQSDGWNEWKGGSHPVKSDVHVEVRFAGGGTDSGMGDDFAWWWDDDTDFNIIAWRLAK